MGSLCVCEWKERERTAGHISDSPLSLPPVPMALHKHRHLCLLVEPRRVYCTLAGILREEGDLEFASTMVRLLNLILFTSTELFDMRMQLKNLSTEV